MRGNEMRLFLMMVAVIFFCNIAIDARLQVGDIAPDFVLLDDCGVQFSLSKLLDQGKHVALCFYPRGKTRYCTKQLCGLRDEYQQLLAKNIVIVGLSYGTVQKNRSFKEEYHFLFPLLSDSSKKVARLYGAGGAWYTFGFIPRRLTFLIHSTGTIVQIIDSVNVDAHAKQILDGFFQLDCNNQK